MRRLPNLLSASCGTAGGKAFTALLATDLGELHRTSVDAVWAASEELEEKWGKPHPATPKLWRAAWEELTPFLACHQVLRRRVTWHL